MAPHRGGCTGAPQPTESEADGAARCGRDGAARAEPRLGSSGSKAFTCVCPHRRAPPARPAPPPFRGALRSAAGCGGHWAGTRNADRVRLGLGSPPALPSALALPSVRRSRRPCAGSRRHLAAERRPPRPPAGSRGSSKAFSPKKRIFR